MKGYVGSLVDLPESVEMANRCIASCRAFGVDAEIVPATPKHESKKELQRMKLAVGHFDKSFSNPAAVLGNFCTMYRTWQKIFHSDKPGIVFEHDAVMIAQLPDLTGKGHIINLGKPSYGNFKSKNKPGVYPMFSKNGGYIPGAHAYYVTVQGAQQLIAKARKIGAAPCDLFLCKKNFPQIKELYPWVAEARDEFSTIQLEKGCKAKHNYNDNYKILT